MATTAKKCQPFVKSLVTVTVARVSTVEVPFFATTETVFASDATSPIAVLLAAGPRPQRMIPVCLSFTIAVTVTSPTWNGEVLFAGGFGYKDLETKERIDADTMWAIASCSKSFTGTLLGMLVDDGVLDFDRPIKDYLPDFKMYDAFAISSLLNNGCEFLLINSFV